MVKKIGETMSSNQELMGYSNKKGFDYLKSHIEKYNLMMDTYVDGKLNFFKRMKLTIDFMICIIVYGVGINDYFQYQFYKKRFNERKQYIVARNRRKLIKKCNGAVQIKDFDDKSIFNSKFTRFLGRDWLDLDVCDISDFINFIEMNPTFITKIKGGSGGNGIEKCKASSENYRALFDSLKAKHVMVEGILAQCEEMSQFNPNSVNTIRVVTIVKDDVVNIVSAVFRCGNGDGCTDNFHHFGLAALIDPETGIVYTQAVDKMNQRYVVHPKSGKQIVGFCVPNWEKVKAVINEVALVDSEVRYVGWDVVICSNGEIAIIEGNCAADPDIAQMPDQIGKYNLYKKFE